MADRKIIVWGEIPVTDMDKAVAFYNAVFEYEMTIDTSGHAFWPFCICQGSGW